MASGPKEVVVFVASPGDVSEERQLVRSTAERVEQACLDLGIRIRVTGWEQIAPGFGRPQDLINPYVDECDVFIAIVHKRWGSDAGAGETGFGEEFQRALDRRQGGDQKPSIALFFKQIDAEDEADPGPQLTRVIEFRNRVKAEHLVLYREFSTIDGLQGDLFHLLVSETVRETGTGRREPAGPAAGEEGVPPPDTVPSDAESAVSNPAAEQIAGVLSGFLEPLKGAPFPDSLDADRLLLFAIAIRNDPLLPTHVSNRLYKRRQELHLLVGESTQWLKAIVADFAQDDESGCVVPGWFFVDDDEIEDRVTSWAFDDDATVARGAAVLLRQLNLRPERLWPVTEGFDASDAASSWWSLIESSGGAGTVFRYLAACASSDDTKLLQAIASLKPESLWHGDVAALCQAVQGDLTALVESAASRTYGMSEWVSDFLSSHRAQLSTEMLLRLTEAKSPAVRDLAHDLISRTINDGSADSSILAAAITSENSTLIDVAFERINQSESPRETALAVQVGIDPERRYPTGRARLESLTTDADELWRKSRDFLELAAWEAFVWTDDDRAHNEARELLREGPAWVDRQLAEHQSLALRQDIVQFLYDERVQTAVQALAHAGVQSRNAEDHSLVRGETERADRARKVEAAMSLAKFADPEDVAVLLSVAESAFGTRRQELMDAAINLGGREAAMALLESSDPVSIRVAAAHLAESEEFTGEQLEELLDSPDSRIRIAAINNLLRRRTLRDLDATIDRYQGRPSYFYNVVAAIDRALFGPIALAPAPVATARRALRT